MRISVVVTTYQQPDWLELVLWGYSAQTLPAHEVLVADDGSGPATATLLDRMSGVLPSLRHVWHEDLGFRKTEILNKAIAASTGEYLLFTDGDCIPHRDLLAVHARYARPRHFLSGGYIKLPMQTSQAITPEDVTSGNATDYRWLRAHGLPLSRRVAAMRLGERVAGFLDRITPTRASFNGHNASVWRADAVAANGFDERMRYGGLDREFGERLENAGVRGLQIRHRSIVVHLDHPRGYRNEETMRRNREIRDETARLRLTRAPVGLDRHLTGGLEGVEPVA